MSSKLKVKIYLALPFIAFIACGSPQSQVQDAALQDAVDFDLDSFLQAIDPSRLSGEDKLAASKKMQAVGNLSLPDFYRMVLSRSSDQSVRIDGHVLLHPHSTFVALKDRFLAGSSVIHSVSGFIGAPDFEPIDRKAFKKNMLASFDALNASAAAPQTASGGLGLDSVASCQRKQNNFDSCSTQPGDYSSVRSGVLSAFASWSDGGGDGGGGPSAMLGQAMCEGVAASTMDNCPNDADRYCDQKEYDVPGNGDGFTKIVDGNTWSCTRADDGKGTRVATNLQPGIDQYCPDSAYADHQHADTFQTTINSKAYECGRSGAAGVRTLNPVGS